MRHGLGGVYFQEFEQLSYWNCASFTLGIAIMLIGLYLITPTREGTPRTDLEDELLTDPSMRIALSGNQSTITSLAASRATNRSSVTTADGVSNRPSNCTSPMSSPVRSPGSAAHPGYQRPIQTHTAACFSRGPHSKPSPCRPTVRYRTDGPQVVLALEGSTARRMVLLQVLTRAFCGAPSLILALAAGARAASAAGRVGPRKRQIVWRDVDARGQCAEACRSAIVIPMLTRDTHLLVLADCARRIFVV